MKKKYFSTKDSPQYDIEITYVHKSPKVIEMSLSRWGYEDIKNRVDGINYHRFPFVSGLKREIIGFKLKNF